MTIGEIVAKHFDEFKNMVRYPDKAIENGNTSEDVFMSAILTALKKYKGDVDEQEGYEYTKKTILMEFLFCYKRKKRDILLLSENIPDIPYSDPDIS